MQNPRKQVKQDLFEDESRRIVVKGEIHFCEGQLFKRHTCRGGIEMNEVLFTRNDIKHLTERGKDYFWDRINCSLVCTYFHQKYGHSSRFRDWWIARTSNLYGIGIVLDWIENAPLKLKQTRGRRFED
jgi:hypothetical protein